MILSRDQVDQLLEHEASIVLPWSGTEIPTHLEMFELIAQKGSSSSLTQNMTHLWLKTCPLPEKIKQEISFKFLSLDIHDISFNEAKSQIIFRVSWEPIYDSIVLCGGKRDGEIISPPDDYYGHFDRITTDDDSQTIDTDSTPTQRQLDQDPKPTSQTWEYVGWSTYYSCIAYQLIESKRKPAKQPSSFGQED